MLILLCYFIVILFNSHKRFIYTSYHLCCLSRACSTRSLQSYCVIAGRFYKWKYRFPYVTSPLFDGKFSVFSLQTNTNFKKISIYLCF